MSAPREYHREKLLAYYLGALDAHEAGQIDRLLQHDEAWQEAAADARRMRAGLEEACRETRPAPPSLGLRAKELLGARSRAVRRVVAVAAGVAATVVAVLGLSWLSVGAPRAALLWRADDALVAGGLLAPEVVARAPDTGEPMAGVELEAVLVAADGTTTRLGAGRTSSAGVLAEPWRVPDVPAGPYTLRVEARDGARRLDSYETPVVVRRGARLAVATDRPAARPGESIRVRALFLRDDGGGPVGGRPVTFALRDPAGNRLGHAVRETSRHGLAWTRFPLDRELPEGTYTIRAEADGTRSVAAFRLEPFRLPAYEVTVKLDRTGFRRDERVTGRIEARTFDGHAIAGLRAVVTGDGRTATLALDAGGSGAFALGPLPAGRRRLRVEVHDAAGQRVETDAVALVLGGSARFWVLPESGELVPGAPNRVYVVARTAAGAPLRGDVTMRMGRDRATIRLDGNGVGVWRVDSFRGPQVDVGARPAGATEWIHAATLDVRQRRAGIVVRSSRAIVAAGDEVEVEVLSRSRRGPVVVSLRSNGRAVAIAGARIGGTTRLRVPNGVMGTLTLEATHFDGARAAEDRKLLVVRGDRSLTVRMRADRERYRPGDRARLAFEVLDAEGRGVPAALSVVGIDAALLPGAPAGLVQALRASAMGALERPGFPLRLDDPAGGHVAVASLRPPTLRAVSRQLDEILPAEALDEYLREGIERMFSPDADRVDRVMREHFLETLDRRGHGATARALRQLADEGTVVGAGWVDQAPGMLAETAVRRSARGDLLLIALLALVQLALARALCRASGARVGPALGALTASALALAMIAGPNVGSPAALTATLLGSTVAAQVAILLARPSRSTGHQAALLAAAGSLAVWLLAGGAAPGLVPLALVLVALQVSTGSGGRAWVPAAFFVLLVLLMSGLVSVLIPRGQQKSSIAEARHTAAFVASVLETAERTAPAGDRAHARSASAPAVEVRDDFRETFCFVPELITDEMGRATIEADVPDSLTRWVVQADAITIGGALAHADGGFVVTKPVSIDLALPDAVTEGDLLHVRAVVRNTTAEARDVRLRLEWPGAQERTLAVPAHGVAATSWPVRFAEPGEARLVVRGGTDAVARVLRVERNARPVEFGATRRIDGAGAITFRVPADAVATVHAHRGPLPQILEGLESMLREPHGCFEQTSSINYPNIMVLRYLKRRGSADPAVRARAEDLLARGAQRLLRFEVGGTGGFSLYGHAPASVWLTAYGLMQLRDMQPVHPVDPKLLARTTRFLARHANEVRWLGETAYVVWALGRDAPAGTVAALRRRRDELEADPYLCALGALALRPHDSALARALARQLDDRELTTRRTVAWGRGRVETHALAALALRETGERPGRADELVRTLLEFCAPYGGWGSTHATVFALKALLAKAAPQGPVDVTVHVDDRTMNLDDAGAFAKFAVGAGSRTARVEGDAVVRIAGTAYVPWTPQSGALRIRYDRTELELGEVVRGVARLEQRSGRLAVPMIEWGLPAGFRPLASDLEAHVAAGRLRRWERAGRSLRLYLAEFDGRAIELSVRFAATARGELRSAASRAYPYYQRDRAVAAAPQRVVVR